MHGILGVSIPQRFARGVRLSRFDKKSNARGVFLASDLTAWINCCSAFAVAQDSRFGSTLTLLPKNQQQGLPCACFS